LRVEAIEFGEKREKIRENLLLVNI
jgi:hypothetical protein